jgi:hypothetical protein
METSPVRTTFRCVSLLALFAAGCGGAKHVQLYDGPKLPDDQVTVLWTNPSLLVEVDRQYKVPANEADQLHRIDLPPGNHAVEVRCRYDKDNISPVIALAMEGDAGHSYKPRAQMGKKPDGVPTCNARMFDVTAEKGGEKVDRY